MLIKQYSVEDYSDSKELLPVFHAKITGGEYGIEILQKNVNEKLKDLHVNSTEEYYSEQEMEKDNPYIEGECYGEYDDENGLIWMIVSTPSEYIFLCNDLIDGHDIMINIIFGDVSNFDSCKKHFIIQEQKHNCNRIQTLPFHSYVDFLWYAFFITEDDYIKR